MNESAGLDYWLANVPMRIAFLFGVTGYVFLFREDGMFGSGPSLASGVGGNLQNSMVFTWGFMELAAWFWVWSTGAKEDSSCWLTWGTDLQQPSRRADAAHQPTYREDEGRAGQHVNRAAIDALARAEPFEKRGIVPHLYTSSLPSSRKLSSSVITTSPKSISRR